MNDVFKMIIPPHIITYLKNENSSLNDDQIQNIFGNYISTLMEENPFDDYLKNMDATLEELGEEIL